MAGTRVLSASIREADEVGARELQVEFGAPVYDLLRLRLANGDPISLEHALLPAEEFPGLLDQPLAGSLMSVLVERYGIEPTQAIERIEVVLAGKDEARLLGTEIVPPLVSVERTTFNGEGRAFELSLDLFRGDRTRLVVETSGSVREVSHSDDGGDAVEVHST